MPCRGPGRPYGASSEVAPCTPTTWPGPAPSASDVSVDRWVEGDSLDFLYFLFNFTMDIQCSSSCFQEVMIMRYIEMNMVSYKCKHKKCLKGHIISTVNTVKNSVCVFQTIIYEL